MLWSKIRTLISVTNAGKYHILCNSCYIGQRTLPKIVDDIDTAVQATLMV